MQKTSVILILAIMTISSFAQTKSLYDFKVNTLYGEEYDLAQLKGKKVLIVNTASKCGFTPQYADLQKLYEIYGGKDFTIIGFPANDFMNQEPGTNEEIASFCQVNYGVTFPMMEKISVKGKEIHPLYQWLTNKSENGVLDAKISWNFNKFLIDENGQVVKHYGSKTNPLSDEIVNWVKSK
ncbi:MAG: glutathione peroxidase [Bacteroidales bacterium]|nr:glutathione peroxidase [Bacteroidales bacterium]